MELNEEQRGILHVVHTFVEKDVKPVVGDLDHADEFPEELTQTMRDMGLFGVTIPERYGGLGLDVLTYALIQIELSRGWMSLSGILNTHFIAAWMIEQFGTDAQRERYLPKMVSGDFRFAYSMTEPGAGSDIQAISTRAERDGDDFLITGQKMWSTNGLRSSAIMLLAKTDPNAVPRYKGMTSFLVEKDPNVAQQPGLTIPPKLRKLGYHGVETTELVFDHFRTPADSVLGGPGAIGGGFRQFMAGVELGRVNVAARAVGISQAAFEAAISYAMTRETFGVPIAQHQAIQIMLADMATKIEASRLLTIQAAEKKRDGKRADLESGMAKLFATEAAQQISLDAMRIHGGYGYSAEYPLERLYRDAPLLIIGEGTNEIQHLIIARRLLERYGSES